MRKKNVSKTRPSAPAVRQGPTQKRHKPVVASRLPVSDTGAEPVGDGTWRGVPSGTVVRENALAYFGSRDTATTPAAEKSSAAPESPCLSAPVEVSSTQFPAPNTDAPVNPVPKENLMFTHVTAGKSKLVRFSVTGLRGLIRFSPTLFSGEIPASVESLNDLPFASPKAGKQPGAPRVKMTPEEKQAAALARKNRTPEQIIADAQARAAKTLALAQKRAAKAA